MLKTRVTTECVPNVDRVVNDFAPQKSKVSAKQKSREVSKFEEVSNVLDASQILSLREILNWGQFANCKGKMKLFFAPKAERPQARQRREAKAQKLCSSCSVRERCQEFARQNHEYGFWGGENEEQRHLAGFTVTAPVGVRTRHLRKPLKNIELF